jgi:hypothetical protein
MTEKEASRALDEKLRKEPLRSGELEVDRLRRVIKRNPEIKEALQPKVPPRP